MYFLFKRTNDEKLLLEIINHDYLKHSILDIKRSMQIEYYVIRLTIFYIQIVLYSTHKIYIF
ncbi:hypothetical protein NIES21_43220 [Anabaenopsis circularis NIES-21]|uniref:Uncharacterized protein n=1 Tax=Anabaenopsis circularis NIES-21 TaxID=1085406 RepID=A0A1Z4GLU0_9CYAN|nr:hypothetical protein NIES21_43220 [Anabaenopsis circularis NIES-21]